MRRRKACFSESISATCPTVYSGTFSSSKGSTVHLLASIPPNAKRVPGVARPGTRLRNLIVRSVLVLPLPALLGGELRGLAGGDDRGLAGGADGDLARLGRLADRGADLQ